MTDGSGNRTSRARRARGFLAATCLLTALPLLGGPAHAGPSTSTQYRPPYGMTLGYYNWNGCYEWAHGFGGEPHYQDAIDPTRYTKRQTNNYDDATGTSSVAMSVRIDPSSSGFPQPAARGRYPYCRALQIIHGLVLTHGKSTDDVLDVEIRYSVPSNETTSSHPLEQGQDCLSCTGVTWTEQSSSVSFSYDKGCGSAACRYGGSLELSADSTSTQQRVLRGQLRNIDGQPWPSGTLNVKFYNDSAAYAYEWEGNVEKMAATLNRSLTVHSITITA